MKHRNKLPDHWAAMARLGLGEIIYQARGTGLYHAALAVELRAFDPAHPERGLWKIVHDWGQIPWKEIRILVGFDVWKHPNGLGHGAVSMRPAASNRGMVSFQPCCGLWLLRDLNTGHFVIAGESRRGRLETRT